MIRPRIFRSHSYLYNAGIAASLLLSIGGVVWGAYVSKQCIDGQRGGALGVAAAFVILFLSRNYGQRVYDSVLKTNPHLKDRIAAISRKEDIEEFSNEDLTWLIIGILGRLNVAADEQKRQNIALVIASVFGTLVWGFGDVVAGWIGGCKS